MPHFESFRSPEAYYATLAHELTTGRSTKAALIATLAASAGAMKAMPAKNWSPNLARHSFALIWP
jgi:antirestriction protein ArdC